MPIHRRLPKRGFTNIFRREYTEINLEMLNRIASSKIGPEEFLAAGLIKKQTEAVKILGRGDIGSAKNVTAHKFSRAAREKIEKAGGQAIVIES